MKKKNIVVSFASKSNNQTTVFIPIRNIIFVSDYVESNDCSYCNIYLIGGLMCQVPLMLDDEIVSTYDTIHQPTSQFLVRLIEQNT